jgi:hypothetical protein
VVFENRGVVPIEAIRTFGVNAKVTDSPVGYFGTGLKYAIAVCLREGLGIEILRGEERLVFTLSETEIRDKKFRIVQMNGEDLGFTDELGKNWELWQAFRELYCNCHDEVDPNVFKTGDEVESNSERTKVVVTGLKMCNEYDDRHQIFILDEKPLVETTLTEVFSGETDYMFYRGVRAGQHQHKSLFRWNMSVGLQLSEDRTIVYEFLFAQYCARSVLYWKDEEMIEKVLLAGDDTFEGNLDFLDCGGVPQEAFLRVSERLSIEQMANMNQSARERMYRATPAKAYEEITLSPVDQKMLDDAVTFNKRLGYDVDRYPIICVEFLGNGIMGIAEKRKIVLSRLAFQMGERKLNGTLFEEWLHLRHRVEDCSREMQNFLLDRLMATSELVVGSMPPVAVDEDEVPF